MGFILSRQKPVQEPGIREEKEPALETGSEPIQKPRVQEEKDKAALETETSDHGHRSSESQGE